MNVIEMIAVCLFCIGIFIMAIEPPFSRRYDIGMLLSAFGFIIGFTIGYHL